MASTTAEFEMAVLCAFQYASASLQDQHAQALKLQAETFCSAIKASADGWRYELELFEFSEHQEVKFYALQALQVWTCTAVCVLCVRVWVSLGANVRLCVSVLYRKR